MEAILDFDPMAVALAEYTLMASVDRKLTAITMKHLYELT